MINVKQERQKLGMTQAALAERLGVDVMTVSRWERGTRTPPPYLKLAFDALAMETVLINL